MALIADLARGLVDLVYPRLCLVCERPAERYFCSACRDQLVRDPFPTCPRCGSTVGPHTSSVSGCPRCRDEHYAFAGVLRMGPYEGMRRDLILRMKHDVLVAQAVGEEFAERITPRMVHTGIFAVVPVPLHWKRRWRRGYNQADVLAKALAEKLRVPCWSRLLKRRRMTIFQAGLPPTARRENLRGAIMARRLQWNCLQDKAVLLVDDVFTTGSTAHAAAVALKAAGAKSVYVAVAAHG
jgi:ComF family protein